MYGPTLYSGPCFLSSCPHSLNAALIYNPNFLLFFFSKKQLYIADLKLAKHNHVMQQKIKSKEYPIFITTNTEHLVNQWIKEIASEFETQNTQ